MLIKTEFIVQIKAKNLNDRGKEAVFESIDFVYGFSCIGEFIFFKVFCSVVFVFFMRSSE